MKIPLPTRSCEHQDIELLSTDTLAFTYQLTSQSMDFKQEVSGVDNYFNLQEISYEGSTCQPLKYPLDIEKSAVSPSFEIEKFETTLKMDISTPSTTVSENTFNVNARTM